MFAAHRRRLIVERLRQHGDVSVDELASALGASAVTLRRDLVALEQEGLLVRRRGGAVLPAAPHGDADDGWLRSEPSAADPAPGVVAPDRGIAVLAARAAELVRPGDAVVLGAGTTVAQVAQALVGVPGLTVVTSSLLVAEAFAAVRDVGVVMTGGSLHGGTLSLVGSAAERSLTGLHARVAVLSGDGVTPTWGVSAGTLDVAGVDRALADVAEQVVVVADHRKLAGDSLFQTVAASRISHLVVDDAVDPAVLAAFTDIGTAVHVATVGRASTTATAAATAPRVSSVRSRSGYEVESS